METHEAEQRRIAAEEAAKVAEKKRLETIRLEQEAEAEKLAEMKREIEVAEQKVKDDKALFERQKFEREATEKAEAQAKIDAQKEIEAEKIMAKAKKEAAEIATEICRHRALDGVGYAYIAEGLGAMPEKDYSILYAKQLKIYIRKLSE